MANSDYPSQQPTRKAWQGMMNRCYTTTNKDYPSVGGAGIGVCMRWRTYENFLLDMGEKPANTVLTRYCQALDFTPENTYWQEKVNTRTNRLYSIWKGVKRRCGYTGKATGRAIIYAERGISMATEWVDSFAVFAACVGVPPSDTHTLDRIDNNAGYYPGNVRWATKKEQANNKSDNVYIEIAGERKTLQEWCEFYGADRAVVSGRFAKLFTLAKGKNQRVQQMSFEGTVIAEYSGVKVAAQATGVKQGTIAKCLSGGNASAGGFLWRYID